MCTEQAYMLTSADLDLRGPSQACGPWKKKLLSDTLAHVLFLPIYLSSFLSPLHASNSEIFSLNLHHCSQAAKWWIWLATCATKARAKL